MFAYSVAYTSYEDSSLIYLLHEKEYTEEEFEQIIFKALTAYLKALKKGDKTLFNNLIEGPTAVSPANIDRFFGFRLEREWPFIGNISDLFPDIGFILEHPTYGFHIVNPKQNVTFFGWQDPFDQKMGWERAWGTKTSPTIRFGAHLMAAGFSAEDSRSYKHDKKHQDSEDLHALPQNDICPQCNCHLRVNLLGYSDTKCWWCPICGAGCTCDQSKYLDSWDAEAAAEEESLFEDLYGW